MPVVFDLNGGSTMRPTTDDLTPVEIFDLRLESGGVTSYPGYGPIAPWFTGPAGPTGPSIIPYARYGGVTVATGKQRYMFPFAVNIIGMYATIDTAPTGASLNFSLAKNGIVIASSSIPAGANFVAESAINTAAAVNDYVTVNVTQVGSTIAGSDLLIHIRYEEAA